jgi:hypothetical protein
MDKKLRFDFSTTQKIINKIGFIDSFKGKWLAIEQVGVDKATIYIVKGATPEEE